MLEVTPPAHTNAASTIGQVVLKRLIVAEQAIDRLAAAETILKQVPNPLRNS